MNARLVPYIVAVAFFMENLDATALVTALPAIAAEFGVAATEASIGITAYLVTIAILIPTSGWLSDRFGARNVFAGAIVLFTLASVGCAASTSLWQFTGMRVLQGAGAALMSPVGRLVVLRSTPQSSLMQAIATITWPGLIAPVIGPPVGGFLTSWASWHWIFLINVPLGIAGLALVLRFVPNTRDATPKPFDGRGFVLTAAALASLMFGLDLAGHGSGTTSGLAAAGLVVLGGALLAVAIRHARRHHAPLVSLAPFAVPTFRVTSLWGGSLSRIAIGATPFLLPLLFQLAFGLDPFVSGLLVLAYMAGNLVMKTATTPILRRFGFRRVLIANGLLVGLSILAFAFAAPDTPLPLLVAALVFCGMVRSMQFTSLNTLAFADIDPSNRSASAMLSSVVQQLSLSLGIALSALALAVGPFLDGGGRAAGLDDFRLAFALMGAVGLVAVLFFRRLDPAAGAAVSGRTG